MASSSSSNSAKAPTYDFLTHYRLKATLGESVFYLKALSDGDLPTQQNHALLASHRLRKALRHPDSTEHALHIAPLEDMEDEELADIILAGWVPSLWMDTYVEVPAGTVLPTPSAPEASDDPLEARENALLAPLSDDEREERSLARERSRIFTEKLATLRAEIAALDHPERLSRARKAVVATQARKEHERAAKKALVMLATYRDDACTQHLWPILTNPSIPQDLIDALALAYEEVGNVSTRFLIERY